MADENERLTRFYDHPTSAPPRPVAPSPFDVRRQERLAKMYDAPPPTPATSKPVPQVVPTPAELSKQARLDRFYDSPDMVKVREHAMEAAARAPAPPPASVSAVQVTTPGPAPKPTAARMPAPPQPPAPTPEALAAELGLDPAQTAAALREMGLAGSDQQAKALGFVKGRQEAATAAWRDQMRSWEEAVAREFSPAELAGARQVVQQHGDKELVDAMNRYGIGSHPALVRFVTSVAVALRRARRADDW